MWDSLPQDSIRINVWDESTFPITLADYYWATPDQPGYTAQIDVDGGQDYRFKPVQIPNYRITPESGYVRHVDGDQTDLDFLVRVD